MAFKKPNKFAVMDVETTLLKDGEFPQTLFWGYADEGGYRKFKTTEQFVNFLRQHEAHTIFFHTNFDVLIMLNDGIYNMKFLRTHNGKLIAIQIYDHILVNSYAIFVSSLEKILKAFGYAKETLDNLDARNYGDCVHARDCFIRLNDLFLREFGVEPFESLTIAGTAFKAAEIHSGKIEKDLELIESFRGGRVEVFDTNLLRTDLTQDFLEEIFSNDPEQAENYLRHKQCDKYDINSSYSASFIDAPERDVLLHCEVVTTDFYGAFFADNVTERLLYPSGRFTTFVFQSTLDRYLHSAKLDKLTILKKYEVKLDWLQRTGELCKKAFARKAEATLCGDKATAEVCKYFLNSLFGRIGLRGVSERCRILPYQIASPGSSQIQLATSKYLTFETIQNEPRANYKVAAFITCNARGRLFAEFARAKPLYCDTDCVIVPANEKPSNSGAGLGQWKYEGKATFAAFNLKNYLWAKEHKLKGGKENTQWTLRQVAAQEPVKLVKKKHSSRLLKRDLKPDGTTQPLNFQELLAAQLLEQQTQAAKTKVNTNANRSDNTNTNSTANLWWLYDASVPGRI